MCKHKSNWDYDQIYAKVSQNSINLLENPSNKEKIWSETSKTVCWDILLQEQYGRCSDTVYWAKNSIAHHPFILNEIRVGLYEIFKLVIIIVVKLEPCVQWKNKFSKIPVGLNRTNISDLDIQTCRDTGWKPCCWPCPCSPVLRWCWQRTRRPAKTWWSWRDERIPRTCWYWRYWWDEQLEAALWCWSFCSLRNHS